MSTVGFSVVPGTCSLTDYFKEARYSSYQELQYIVIEANGARIQAAILWNTIVLGRTKYSLTDDQAMMLRQATVSEKQHHGLTLSAAELQELRFPDIQPESRIRSRVAKTPPTSTYAPSITPDAIAATLTNLQKQISKLTGEVVALREQLLEAISDKARLTQQLADTQAQLITLTDSFKLLLTQQ